MESMNEKLAQRIFNGPWQHAAAAVEACRRGEWPRFVRNAAPRKPLLLGRLAHGRCVALAASSFTEPTTTTATLVPLWACWTYETASADWVAVHALAIAGEPLEVIESGPHLTDSSLLVNGQWECAVRRWTVATVGESWAYAPSIPMRLRAGAFVVIEQRVYEILSVDVRETEPLSRPTREVPIFASWYEPRLKVSPDLESQIRATSFTAPGERD
jgi:hypothetical protein